MQFVFSLSSSFSSFLFSKNFALCLSGCIFATRSFSWPAYEFCKTWCTKDIIPSHVPRLSHNKFYEINVITFLNQRVLKRNLQFLRNKHKRIPLSRNSIFILVTFSIKQILASPKILSLKFDSSIDDTRWNVKH